MIVHCLYTKIWITPGWTKRCKRKKEDYSSTAAGVDAATADSHRLAKNFASQMARSGATTINRIHPTTRITSRMT